MQTLKNEKSIYKSRGFELCCVYIVVFLALFLLNYFTPPISDDYGYSMVKSIREAFELSILHWFHTNGRAPMTFLLYLFNLAPKLVVDVFNSLSFTALCWLVAAHAKKSVKLTAQNYALVALTGFFVFPMIGSTCLWVAGAASYLWPATLVLAFLLPYRIWSPATTQKKGKHQLVKKNSSPVLFAFLMTVFGLFAGWSTECTGIAAVAIITCFLAIGIKRKAHHPAWMYAGWLSSSVGFALVIFAPGISERKELAAQAQGLHSTSVLSLLKANLLLVPRNTLGHNWPLVLFVIFAAITTSVMIRRHHEKPIAKMWPLLFAMGGTIALIPAAVNATSRAQFFGGVLFVLAFYAFCSQTEASFQKKTMVRFVVVLAILNILVFNIGFADTLRLYRYDLKRKEIALEQLSRGTATGIKLPLLNEPRWMVLNQWSASWEEGGYGMTIPSKYVNTLGGISAYYTQMK